MPFVLVVLGLLGGGLICLLVINTTLGAATFRISQLQQTGARLAQQQQALQGQVALEESPAEIAKRAYQLGMRVRPTTTILDLPAHKTYVVSGNSGADVNLGAPPSPAPSPAQTSPSAAATTTPTASPSPASGSPATGSGR